MPILYIIIFGEYKVNIFKIDFEKEYNITDGCCYCEKNGFDADSCKEATKAYMMLYFSRERNSKVRLYGTDKEWQYKIERQPGTSKKYQIRLYDEKTTVVLRGDTLGTYKKVLNCTGISNLCLEYILNNTNIDVSTLKFCDCKNMRLRNNHGLESFLLIPKVPRPYISINTERSKAPYWDNPFIFLNIIKNVYLGCKYSDALYEYIVQTADFWNCFGNGLLGYNRYIKCMGLEGFDKLLDDKIVNSYPELWNEDDMNYYIKQLNLCLKKRKHKLMCRAGIYSNLFWL